MTSMDLHWSVSITATFNSLKLVFSISSMTCFINGVLGLLLPTFPSIILFEHLNTLNLKKWCYIIFLIRIFLCRPQLCLSILHGSSDFKIRSNYYVNTLMYALPGPKDVTLHLQLQGF